MIRVIYRWTVKPGDEEQFIRDWQAGTRKIQDNCAGAHDSFLIRDRKTPSTSSASRDGKAATRGVLRSQ